MKFLSILLIGALAASCSENRSSHRVGDNGGAGGTDENGSGGESGTGGGTGDQGGAGGLETNSGGGSGSAGGGSTGGSGGAHTGGSGGAANTGGNRVPDAGADDAAGPSGNQDAAGDNGFGNALFLAVGKGNTAMSTDGKSWTVYPDGMTPNALEILGACLGQGVVLAINHTGNATVHQGVWSSTNGHNFTRIYPVDPTRDGLPGESCVFANGIFSAGFSYSLDAGKTWTRAAANVGAIGNRAVTYGNGVFVGAGSGDLDWSVDGKSWTLATIANGGVAAGLLYATFSGGKFLVMPLDNANPSFESTDGKNWVATRQKLPAGQNYTIGAGVHKLFAGTYAGGVYWLPDSTAPGTSDWTKVTPTLNDGTAIGGNDSIAVTGAHWSTDGVTWNASRAPIPRAGYSIGKILTLK